MPFQGLPWTEFISCPVCFKLFNERQQRPISLGCGHTVCKSCIKSRLTDNRCPFDQTVLPSDVDKLPANFALMHLVGAAVPEQEKEAVRTVSDNPKSYEQARKCIEEMAVHLKPLAENASDDDSSTCSEQSPSKSNNHNTAGSSGTVGNSSTSKCVLSRPMQRKLISLIHCQLLEEEGRSRAARIARSLGERIVSELLVMHQYPHQLSANLWAAVRTRGCQFLGPAMQEEVLKLILLALEDGSFLSRKVLVLFVVQRLESRYPQASKTAIGHVVQLLYRASCFKVLKREEESSLMQLKEEFRQYESLRREHDSQIVEIAIEAGLRISPEQWSSLLYGDPAHKSHMQSIIDKHQSPQSFAQSVTELMLTLQRSNDHSGLLKLQPQLEFLSNIDPSPDCPAPSWENLEAIMRSLNTVMTAFVEFLSNPDHKSRLETAPVQNTRYKTSMCRDFSAKGTCPRGNTCTFAHSQDELERYRSRSRRNGGRGPVGVLEKTSSSLSPFESDQLRQVQLLSKLKVEAVARNGAVKVSGSSQSADELLDPKFVASTLSSEASPVFTKPAQTQGHAAGMMHSKLSPRAVDAIGNKCTEPEKPPFVPPPPQLITETRLTFSCPGLDGSDTPNLPTLGPQTCFHPNSHNAYAHAPLLQNPMIHSPPIRPHHVSAQGTHLMMQPPFPSGPLTRPPSHHVLQNVPIAHGSQNLAVAHGSQSLPMALGSQSLPVALGSQSLPVALGSQSLPVALGSQSLPVALGSSTSTQAVSAFIPSGELGFSSVNMTASHQQAADTTAMCNSCIPYIQVHHVERQHPMPYALQVGDSLEDLAIRKQQIINHLQVEPVFMESGTSLQLADGHKGFAGLKTVLTNNKQMQEAMPKSVSDMFVATRSTQSLDELLNDDIQQYSSKWSLGEINHGDVTSGGSDTQLDPSPRGPLPDSRTTNSISISMGARPTSGSLDATGNNRLHTSVESATGNADVHVTTQSSSSNEAEFCSFPNDDSDESFIPFEHVSVSRFGPISRMSKMKTYNSAPVQVTAESYKWMTPVLSVTPLDRPVATSMQMPTRFPPRTGTELLTTEPAVKPTPTEIPSIWQQPPHPSYHNIALMKAGAAEAVTNNERLAYELQAIELEIALKTGKEPEPVTKIIQDAVMAPSQVQTLYHPTSDLVTSKGNSFMTVMGRGHVTDCLANIEAGASLVPPQQAAQHFMEDYYRSWQGIKK